LNKQATKSWAFGGSRADCQAFSGSSCNFVEADGATRFSTLFGCDTVVIKTIDPSGVVPEKLKRPNLLQRSTD
jgi:hypothetical protein